MQHHLHNFESDLHPSCRYYPMDFFYRLSTHPQVVAFVNGVGPVTPIVLTWHNYLTMLELKQCMQPPHTLMFSPWLGDALSSDTLGALPPTEPAALFDVDASTVEAARQVAAIVNASMQLPAPGGEATNDAKECAASATLRAPSPHEQMERDYAECMRELSTLLHLYRCRSCGSQWWNSTGKAMVCRKCGTRKNMPQPPDNVRGIGCYQCEQCSHYWTTRNVGYASRLTCRSCANSLVAHFAAPTPLRPCLVTNEHLARVWLRKQGLAKLLHKSAVDTVACSGCTRVQCEYCYPK